MHKRIFRLAEGDGRHGIILLLTILVGALTLMGAISYGDAAVSNQAYSLERQFSEETNQEQSEQQIETETTGTLKNAITEAESNLLNHIKVVQNKAAESSTTPTDKMEFLGTLSSTAYTNDGSNMANGEYPYVGAVACNLVPIGTLLYIEGMGTFVVKDRIGHGSQLDFFMETEDECNTFGRRALDVYIVN